MNWFCEALWCSGMRSVPVGQSIAAAGRNTNKVFLCNGLKRWCENISKACFASGETQYSRNKWESSPMQSNIHKCASKIGKSCLETEDWKNLPDLNSTKAIFSKGKKGNKPHFPSGTSNRILLLHCSLYSILTNPVTFPTVSSCTSAVYLIFFPSKKNHL